MSGGPAWHIDVLGPIRVRADDGEDRTPDGALQRRLLALLVLHRGRVVSTDAAIEALWPSAPPRDPQAALQTHLFRLRKALPGLVGSTDAGYRLDPAMVTVDSDDLAAAVAAVSDDPAAGATIAAALDRWRGPGYPELADDDAGRAEATRLEELRTVARERQAEALLARGATDGLVVDLAALVDEHPLRERPRSLLMAALAADGRTADALRTYDDFRRLLGDELGIEPSAALAAEHAELLASSPRSVWSLRDRLPATATSLLGRDELLAEAEAIVEHHRVLTLLGPGGVGKTRLAIELGHRLRAGRPDRPVVLIELATATAESAVEAVAAALAIDGRPGVGLAERLPAVLAELEVVLLFDNCEHVLDPIADLVERLIAACPKVTMVTTTRERLRVSGEVLCPVPTLPASTHYDPATQLFVERAAAVSPGFAPGPADLTRISEIVRRLDGLPLAIELAAARLHTLDVAEVAAGLDRRFRLLSTGSRTSTRHGSLSAAVEWSVGLLDDDLRRTFAELSVCAGSFTVAEAVAITTAGPDAVEAVAQLAERSLVMRVPGRRYVLLETLRAYGTELLEQEGSLDDARRRHATHVLDRIEAANRALVTPRTDRLLERIDAALPELRAAFDWHIEQGELDGAGRMVVALQDYGFHRLRPDVLAWAERLCAADPDDRSPLAGQVWAVSALASWMSGDLEETGRRTERAATIATRPGVGEPASVATAQGSQALFEGRLDDAARHYRRAAGLAGDDDARRLVATGSEILALAYAGRPEADERATTLLEEVADLGGPHAAYAWYCAGEADLAHDPARAQQRFARALDLAEHSGASFVSGVAGTSNASVEARIGDVAVAAKEYRRLLTHWRRAGMWATQWTMLRSVALVLEAQGLPREAAVLAGAVQATTEGHRIFGADEAALAALAGRLRLALGDEGYETATAEGALLDGHAAVEHALRCL
jgi:predicted ATPase/DNA-binding SARP family transcriptional activator